MNLERMNQKAAARRAARDLLGQSISDDDFQIDYDAKVDIPRGGDEGGWVTVRVWVRLNKENNHG